MYDTGLGAIAYSGGSLLQKLQSRKVLRPLARFTVLKPKSTVTQFFKPKAPVLLAPKPTVSPVPLSLPSVAPLAMPSISLSATGGAGGTPGSAGGGTSLPGADTTEVDTTKLRGALSATPLVLVGVGVLALYMMSKRGR